MKKIFLIIVSCFLINCGSNKKAEVITDENQTITTQTINPSELIKYKSVKEMLEAANDFTIEQGTLKFINNDENNLHIQISKPIMKNDSDKIIDEIIKRDIVYIAFQAFAQTSINKITIISIPIDLEDNKKYYDNYKQTVTITRDKADQIMQKEFGSVDYSILFINSGGIQVPSENFDKLKYEKLNHIYTDLSKN